MPLRTSPSRVLSASILLLILISACAKRPPSPPKPVPPGLRTQKPYKIHGTWYYPLPSAEGYREEGLASWYGADFHGKPTACGEPFDMNAMTAAHKTLPIGSHVKVSHLENGRSVIVRINDRGPFVRGRIIDLSCRASQVLGMGRAGVARVRVEAVQVATEQHIGQNTYWKVDPIPSFRYGHFTIQIGSFREQKNAYRLQARMASAYKRTQIEPFDHGGDIFYRVQVGSYQDLVLAQQAIEQLRRQGFGDAFVVALEEKK